MSRTIILLLIVSIFSLSNRVVTAQDIPAPSDPIPTPQALSEKTNYPLKRRILQAIMELKSEPTFEELQKEALKLANADRRSVKGWQNAPKVSALLPVIKLVAQRDTERDESLDRYQDQPDRWGADTDLDLGLQISAQWYLPKLIFNPDEVRVYSALADRARRREELSIRLVGYYFERQKLIVELRAAPPEDALSLAQARLRIEELTGVIDALTGGLLTRRLSNN